MMVFSPTYAFANKSDFSLINPLSKNLVEVDIPIPNSDKKDNLSQIKFIYVTVQSQLNVDIINAFSKKGIDPLNVKKMAGIIKTQLNQSLAKAGYSSVKVIIIDSPKGYNVDRDNSLLIKYNYAFDYLKKNNDSYLAGAVTYSLWNKENSPYSNQKFNQIQTISPFLWAVNFDFLDDQIHEATVEATTTLMNQLLSD